MLQKRDAEAATKQSEAGDDATPRRIFRDCPDCLQMIVVPAGHFTMGSPNDAQGHPYHEGPQHEVTIDKLSPSGWYSRGPELPPVV
jgi:formylglycine-generating enzyme required for sulfatase activity